MTDSSAGTTSASTRSSYQLFMFALCVIALAFLAVQSSPTLDVESRAILEYADFAICILFFIDFVYSFATGPDRLKYMRTWGWIDLVSSIPVVGPLRLGRAVRIVRILRVLRGVRSARLIVQIVMTNRTQSAFLGAVTLALLLIVCSSIAVLQFENAPTSNIHTGADAMWWAVTTMSKVGYGDFFPVTTEGRIVAVFLMAGGIGVFGTFSALLAAWFIGTKEGS